jgi:pimeloyl-ACP methyl ester carboxylesterase
VTAINSNAEFKYSQDITIHYEIRGVGIPPLLLLHGFGASIESWRDVQPMLEARHRLYLVDMKGFGRSSKPNDKRYSIADQAEIICALIRHLQLDNFGLVGHSYGGAVAMLTYLNLKSSGPQISKLVLLDAPGYPQHFPFFITILRAPILNRLSLNLTPASTRARFILDHIFWDKTRVTNERVHRYAQFFDLPGSHDALVDSARQLVPSDPSILSGRISQIKVPTLILWGRRDPLVELWQAQRMNKEIENSRLEILENCGHVPQEERPEDTAELLIRFLS